MTLYFEAECVAATAPIAPAGWAWCHWDALEGRLFLPLERLRNSRYRPFLGPLSRTFVAF